jgi:hypothetical protein
MAVVFHHIGSPKHKTSSQNEAMMSERLQMCDGCSGGGSLSVVVAAGVAAVVVVVAAAVVVLVLVFVFVFVAVAVVVSVATEATAVTPSSLVGGIAPSISETRDPSLRLLTVEEDIALR